MRYEFKIGQHITGFGPDDDAEDTSRRRGISDEILGVFLKETDDLLPAWQKAANKGGPLSVVLTREVTALDGGTVPPGASAPALTLTGLTRESLYEVQQKQMQALARINDKTGKHVKAHKAKHP